MINYNMARVFFSILIILSFPHKNISEETQHEPTEEIPLVQSNEGINQIKFKRFISKFKSITYPFIANTGCYEPDSALSVPLDMDNDSTFINYSGPGISVGLFPDTSNFYIVIFCTASVCYMPSLAVYSKEGELLSLKEISNGCGSGEGYKCSETLTINSFSDIVLVNTQENMDMDSFGNEIRGSWAKTIDTYIYNINNKGIINVNISHVEQKNK